MPGGALNQGTKEPPPFSDWRMPKPNRSSRPRWSLPYQTVRRLSVRSRGKKNWWGGGKHAIDPAVSFRDQCPMPDGEVSILGVRGRLIAVEFPFSVHPGESHRLTRLRECEAGVVQDRASILLRVDDRLDVNEPGARVDRQIRSSPENGPHVTSPIATVARVTMAGHPSALQVSASTGTSGKGGLPAYRRRR